MDDRKIRLNLIAEVPLRGKNAVGKQCLVDIADVDLVLTQKWHVCHGYARTRSGNGHLLLHHLIIERMGLELPPGYVVDHRDRNRLNNTRRNLHVVTPQENAHNLSMKKNNKSGYTGVSWAANVGKWYACIRRNYRRYDLGRYDTLEDAVRAYEAAKIHFDEHQ